MFNPDKQPEADEHLPQHDSEIIKQALKDWENRLGEVEAAYVIDYANAALRMKGKDLSADKLIAGLKKISDIALEMKGNIEKKQNGNSKP